MKEVKEGNEEETEDFTSVWLSFIHRALNCRHETKKKRARKRRERTPHKREKGRRSKGKERKKDVKGDGEDVEEERVLRNEENSR